MRTSNFTVTYWTPTAMSPAVTGALSHQQQRQPAVLPADTACTRKTPACTHSPHAERLPAAKHDSDRHRPIARSPAADSPGSQVPVTAKSIRVSGFPVANESAHRVSYRHHFGCQLAKWSRITVGRSNSKAAMARGLTVQIYFTAADKGVHTSARR